LSDKREYFGVGVMAGLVLAIPLSQALRLLNRDARHKAGHDGFHQRLRR
jgi:hypothetical protein